MFFFAVKVILKLSIDIVKATSTQQTSHCLSGVFSLSFTLMFDYYSKSHFLRVYDMFIAKFNFK